MFFSGTSWVGVLQLSFCSSYCVVVIFLISVFFFFFSSRRRHTRCREVSWARRCVQETGFGAYAPPDKKLNIFCGTPSYMPPEIVNKREYIGPPVDMWSLGVLLYIMLCGTFPFRGSTETELFHNISKGIYYSPSFVSRQITKILAQLLNIDPECRASSSDISLQDN
eukprot:TRINITY_DN60037_c0_g1_i2.p2 TRINITY_DN60037_c0_g1~~TRINITY_DN60037_c0_g1_i2.p2  ORF type:complete len:167 (+),score=38.04 TRINITY_DN60037_c0_g1_i2:3-503(+)